MSSLAKKIGKQMGRTRKLFFPVEMYNNCYGSVAISWCIFNQPDYKVKTRLAERFQELAKDPDNLIDFIWDDPAFIEKTCKLFDIPFTTEFKQSICMVKSKFNVLFAPYLVFEDGGHVLPLREDGFTGPTLRHGEVTYPLA